MSRQLASAVNHPNAIPERLTGGLAQRNAEGKITKAAAYQSRDAPVARVEPNRKWFNNTRVISQDALDMGHELDPGRVTLACISAPNVPMCPLRGCRVENSHAIT